MLTLEEMYQHYFPDQPYSDMTELDIPIRLWDFLIFLSEQGYVFTNVYFGHGNRRNPEIRKSRPPSQELDKLAKTLTEPRKSGQNNFIITDYYDYYSAYNNPDQIERINHWEGGDLGKRRGEVSIEPQKQQPEFSDDRRSQDTITGFKITIKWYVMERNGVAVWKTWIIYLGTQSRDIISANFLNTLMRPYLTRKFIINYCLRMPTIE